MLQRKASKVGRPKEVKGVGKPTMLYLDDTRLSDFKRLCENEYHISASEGLRQLIEQELEKNEVGTENPLKIQYGLTNKNVKPRVEIPLDEFIDVFDARFNADKLKQEHMSKLFANCKKYMQIAEYRMHGKITV